MRTPHILVYWGSLFAVGLLGLLLGRFVGTIIGGDTLSGWGMPLIGDDIPPPPDRRDDPENLQYAVRIAFKFLFGDDPAGAIGAAIGLIPGIFGGIMLFGPIEDYLNRTQRPHAGETVRGNCEHPVSHQTMLREDESDPRRITAINCSMCGERLTPNRFS